MQNQTISRRELFTTFIKTITSQGKTISIYGIEDILPLTFVWRPYTKWAVNNNVLSVSDENGNLLFSELLTDIQLYVAQRMDGTKTISELCSSAELNFDSDQTTIQEDVLLFVCAALKDRLIEARK